MTKASYDQIKAFFITLWGEYAGWAHSVLFTADLRAFKVEVVKTETSTVELKAEPLDDKIETVKLEKDVIVKTEDNVEQIFTAPLSSSDNFTEDKSIIKEEKENIPLEDLKSNERVGTKKRSSQSDLKGRRRSSRKLHMGTDL